MDRNTLLREKDIISTPTRRGLLPIGHATFWGWAKTGYLPAPVRLGERITAWRYGDLLDFIENHKIATGKKS